MGFPYRRISSRGLALGVVVALLAGACSSSGATTAPSAASAGGASPSGAPIVIGGVGPLSLPGDVAGGTEMKWAMEQAISDLNAKGGILGRPVVLKFYDTMNKPDVCAQSAKSLVEVDKAVAVVGELHSGCAEAEEPALEAGNMPTVFSDTYADAVTAGDPTANPPLPANAPTIFRIAPTNSYVSGFIAEKSLPEPLAISSGYFLISIRHPLLSVRCKCRMFSLWSAIVSIHLRTNAFGMKCRDTSSSQPRQRNLGWSTISTPGIVHWTPCAGALRKIAAGRSCRSVWMP